MSRRRPTLPPRCQGSTIGAEGLNCRVRNGTGCFPFAIATETAAPKHRSSEAALRNCLKVRAAGSWTRDSIASASKSQVLGLLVPVG